MHKAYSERQIVDILAKRTSAQRLAICDQFENLYHESLTKNIGNQLFGNFGDLVKQLLIPLPELYASKLNNNHNHDILIETMFTLNSTKVFLIKNKFEESKYILVSIN